MTLNDAWVHLSVSAAAIVLLSAFLLALAGFIVGASNRRIR